MRRVFITTLRGGLAVFGHDAGGPAVFGGKERGGIGNRSDAAGRGANPQSPRLNLRISYQLPSPSRFSAWAVGKPVAGIFSLVWNLRMASMVLSS